MDSTLSIRLYGKESGATIPLSAGPGQTLICQPYSESGMQSIACENQTAYQILLVAAQMQDEISKVELTTSNPDQLGLVADSQTIHPSTHLEIVPPFVLLNPSVFLE